MMKLMLFVAGVIMAVVLNVGGLGDQARAWIGQADKDVSALLGIAPSPPARPAPVTSTAD